MHKPLLGAPNQLIALVSVDADKIDQVMDYYIHNSDREDDVYFYHGDHLGSASWITDASSIPVQHLQYLPFGEPFVDQHAPLTTYNERYTFTGKERDSETGYSYFGARYYDSDLSGLFLSVDPMSDKYPSISPYAYCAWNPLKLVDPDGREFGDFYGRNGQYLGNDGKNDGSVYLIKNGRDAPLGTWDLFKAEWKVRLHSGNRDYFDKHSEVYDNFIETVPYNLLGEAYNSIQDDGTGGIGDANNREYGGYANAEGTAWERTDIQGPVGNPQEQVFLPIYGLKDGRIKFHSHASGTRTDGNAGFSNSVGVSSFNNNTVHVDSWVQIPSEVDIGKSGIKPSYVFGMGNRTLSVYNNNGIQATLPLKGTSLGKKIGVK